MILQLSVPQSQVPKEPMGKEARGIQVGPEMMGYGLGHMKLVGAHSELVATTVVFLGFVKYPETGKAKRISRGPFRGIQH